jgi:hypothetical protein
VVGVPNIDSSQRDSSSPVWDMSHERAFMETLLGQRFNFFLVFFSFVLAGALNSHTQRYFQLILSLGTIICWRLALVVIRTQQEG